MNRSEEIQFAIVTPNLNQSRFLHTALESLRHQRVAFEFALMDGGSTDHFIDTVKPYADLIQYQRSSPDKGQADAINQGIRMVRGDIIGWLNADDYYFPGALEAVSECFSSKADIDVVYGDAIHVSKDGFFQSYFPPIQQFDFDVLTQTCFICQPACFFRRRALERVGGLNTSLCYTMDWDLWCRLAISGAKFVYLPRLIAAVRYYPETKTLSGNFRRYMEMWRVERKYGRRVLPRSWPGTFMFEIQQNPPGTFLKKTMAIFFEHLKSIKPYLRFPTMARAEKGFDHNGFSRWENRVEGRGRIELPWYSNRRWARVRLTVQPVSDQYEIRINDKPAEKVALRDGFLWAEVPDTHTNHWIITVKCLIQRRWRLLDFWCQLDESKPENQKGPFQKVMAA